MFKSGPPSFDRYGRPISQLAKVEKSESIDPSDAKILAAARAATAPKPKQPLVYAPGTIVIMEEGAYSDFGICGLLVMLQSVDIRAAAKQFRIEARDAHHARVGKDEYRLSRIDAAPGDFVTWLCKNQMCARLESKTLNLGSYSYEFLLPDEEQHQHMDIDYLIENGL